MNGLRLLREDRMDIKELEKFVEEIVEKLQALLK